MSEEVQNNTAAITSLNVAVANLTSRVDGVTVKIPNAASKDNRLADKEWVQTRYDSDIKDLKDNKIALDGGVIPSSYLPGYVDDVVEHGSRLLFPAKGESGKLYVDISTKLVYRWSGSDYVEISPSLALGETSATAFPGDRGKFLEAGLSSVNQSVSRLSETVEEQAENLAGKQDKLTEEQVDVLGSGVTADGFQKKRDYEDLTYNKPYGPARYYGDVQFFLDQAPVVLMRSSLGTFDQLTPVVESSGTDSTGPILKWGEGSTYLKWEILFSGSARLTFSAYGTVEEIEFPFYDDANPIPSSYTVVHPEGGPVTWYIYGKQDELATKTEVNEGLSATLPRYPFVNAAIVDGVVAVAPYTNAKLVSDGTAFSVAVGGESGCMRDCVLRVECGDTAPKITWGESFHPRTDAETDFACVAGVRNVYWISEHSPNEFCVAGWQETEGGNQEDPSMKYRWQVSDETGFLAALEPQGNYVYTGDNSDFGLFTLSIDEEESWTLSCDNVGSGEAVEGFGLDADYLAFGGAWADLFTSVHATREDIA